MFIVGNLCHVPLSRKGGTFQDDSVLQVHGPEPDAIDALHDMIPRMSRKYLDTHFVAIYVPPEKGHNVSILAKENGFSYHKPLLSGEDQGYHLISRSANQINQSHGLDKDERVEWWETQQPKARAKKDVQFSDPLYNEQWHLNSREHRSHTKTAGNPVHINTFEAWNSGYNGRGTVIGIVDDGLERTHPDLSGNFRGDLSYDWNDDDNDPTPSRRDGHGTSASGVAAADADTSCGVGVAYGAGLAGQRLLGSWATDSEEAQALSNHCRSASQGGSGAGSEETNVIQVYSNSWGPIDDGARLDGPGRLAAAAIEHCIEYGRGGKGSIYVWAGGNGRNRLDNSNYDGYANSRYTIAVAATDDYGKFTWYSEPGANIICTAPSSGDSYRGIVTTDLQGSHGANPHGDCTTSFGGTSATSPQVAGIAAMMLQANPRLGWRDVQHILASSSKVVDRSPGQWIQNDAGYFHSYSYGFGLVDASEAVRQATYWTPVVPMPSLSTEYMAGGGEDIAYQHVVALEWNPSQYNGLYNTFVIEHVEVYIQANTPKGHGYMGVQICSPVGTCSILAEGGSPGRDSQVDWTFMTVRNWGERVAYPPSVLDPHGQHTNETNNDGNGYHDVDKNTETRQGFNTGNNNNNNNNYDRLQHPTGKWILRVGNFYSGRSAPISVLRWKLTFHGCSPYTSP